MTLEDRLPRLKYTLCFIISQGDILMLHRKKAPNQGQWNGVGGKLEAGETPRASVLREVAEETGIVLPDVRFAGILTWSGGFETSSEGGLYLYVGRIPAKPWERRVTEEGDLAWMSLDQIAHAPDVVDNIPHFLPAILANNETIDWHSVYVDQRLQQVTQRTLPAV